MSVDIEQLLIRLTAPGSGGTQQVVDLALRTPERLTDLVVKAASALATRSSVAVDAALALVPDDSLQTVADAAVASLQSGSDPNDGQAANLIAALSLQAPHTLGPNLSELWAIAPNLRSYDAFWPWRAADEVEIGRLAARLSSPPRPSGRGDACSSLGRSGVGRSRWRQSAT